MGSSATVVGGVGGGALGESLGNTSPNLLSTPENVECTIRYPPM